MTPLYFSYSRTCILTDVVRPDMQLTERITELERAVRDSEQGKREAVALAQQHRDEIRRLRDDIGIKRNEAETARQEIDIGREENDIAREEINIARQEIELKTEEIDRLQRRVSTAEAARHEKEQQLNEYLNVLTIETEELTLDQAQLGSGAFGGIITRFSIILYKLLSMGMLLLP